MSAGAETSKDVKGSNLSFYIYFTNRIKLQKAWDPPLFNGGKDQMAKDVKRLIFHLCMMSLFSTKKLLALWTRLPQLKSFTLNVAFHTNFQKILLQNWWNTTLMGGQLGEQKIIARLPNWKGSNLGFSGQAVKNCQSYSGGGIVLRPALVLCL